MSLASNNLDIKKKLQIQANFFLEIMEVLQKLETRGKLNELITCLKSIHSEEQCFLMQGKKFKGNHFFSKSAIKR